MIKLNRTTEYGIIALHHMSRKTSGEVTSAREVATQYGLPFEITAKTLQRLKDTGIIQSEQGARGGYTLSKGLNEITLAEFLELMEGPQAVVACRSQDVTDRGDGQCGYHSACGIKGWMSDLNSRIIAFLGGITLSELAPGRAASEQLFQITKGAV